MLLQWPVLHVLITLLSQPGPGRVIRIMLGWSQLEKTARSGVCLFQSALREENLLLSLRAAGDWVKKGSYHTAWSVPLDSSCTCSYAYGRGPAIGPHTGRRCWPLLAGVWRAIAPLMKPWCAEGDLPTAANLNLHRGWKSCVGWHCDDEPLFGECGDAKLIVSVSLGNFAVFRWRRQSCLSDEGRSCRLDHGDILVMDGQCQDGFLHRTGSGRDQERINVTFRWIQQHVSSCPFLKAGDACCLPTCAQGSSVPNTGNLGNGGFVFFMFLFGALCMLGAQALPDCTLWCTRLGSRWCASCWTRPVGGGRWGRYLCNLWGECLTAHKSANRYFWFHEYFLKMEPNMEASEGQPSLRGYYARMVYWTKGAHRRLCRQEQCETSFCPFGVFLFSRNSRVRFLGLLLWHLWSGRARHSGPNPLPQHVGVEVFNVGGWLVGEHRVIPARVRSEWTRLRRKGVASIGAPSQPGIFSCW